MILTQQNVVIIIQPHLSQQPPRCHSSTQGAPNSEPNSLPINTTLISSRHFSNHTRARKYGVLIITTNPTALVSPSPPAQAPTTDFTTDSYPALVLPTTTPSSPSTPPPAPPAHPPSHHWSCQKSSTTPHKSSPTRTTTTSCTTSRPRPPNTPRPPPPGGSPSSWSPAPPPGGASPSASSSRSKTGSSPTSPSRHARSTRCLIMGARVLIVR